MLLYLIVENSQCFIRAASEEIRCSFTRRIVAGKANSQTSGWWKVIRKLQRVRLLSVQLKRNVNIFVIIFTIFYVKRLVYYLMKIKLENFS